MYVYKKVSRNGTHSKQKIVSSVLNIIVIDMII